MIPGLIGGALGLLGNLFTQNKADQNLKKQLDMQREMAQYGIRWKVADAKAAGIHPLVGVGSVPFNFSPVSVGGADFGATLGEMGANIDRAVMAQKSTPERANIAGTALQLERGKLENDLLKVQIEKTKRELPPPMPSIVPPKDQAQPFVTPWGDTIAPPPGVSSADHLETQIGEASDWVAWLNWALGKKVGSTYYKGNNVPPGQGWLPSFSYRFGPPRKRYYDRVPYDPNGGSGW